ncbi:hypothetical protein GQ457_14G022320 [Hibiscus cannabinus]
MAFVSPSENDNKENIPPFSSKNSTYILTKPPSSNNPKTKLRKPLQDITNLILPQVYSTPIRSDSATPVSFQFKNGVRSTCKKTCFVHPKRRLREPLQDITNLILPQVSSTLVRSIQRSRFLLRVKMGLDQLTRKLVWCIKVATSDSSNIISHYRECFICQLLNLLD